MKTRLTLTNNFHDTSVQLNVTEVDSQLFLSPRQISRTDSKDEPETPPKPYFTVQKDPWGTGWSVGETIKLVK